MLKGNTRWGKVSLLLNTIEKKSLNLEWINEWFTELLLNTDIIF
jgi:hypothetical protein